MSDSKHLTVACPSCSAPAGIGCVISEPRGGAHDGGLWMWHSARWPSANDAPDDDWRARALAAEQRAEAAEAERDRMRPVVEAAVAWSKWDPKNGLYDSVCAYRAGQPATSDAERIAAPLVCSTCNDTHRITLGDREVPCTRCPVPCETCRSRPAGAGPGAYCAGTPCGCPCHRAGAWRKP